MSFTALRIFSRIAPALPTLRLPLLQQQMQSLRLSCIRPLSIGLRTKVASKRLYKKHKLKNHRGASSRWLMVGHGQFLRKQAGTTHYNRKMSALKKRSKRKKVLANVQQRNLLRKLVPYWRKKYMRRVAANVNPSHIDL